VIGYVMDNVDKPGSWWSCSSCRFALPLRQHLCWRARTAGTGRHDAAGGTHDIN